jgi:hypothetical protein
MRMCKTDYTIIFALLLLLVTPSRARAEKLGIGIVTSYFGSHPQLQKYATDTAAAIARQHGGEALVDIIPVEVTPGATITVGVSDIESKLPQVPMSQKSSGHDNEKAIRYLSSRYERFVLISNGPSVGASGVLTGGGIPSGFWKRVFPISGSNSKLHIWGSPTITEQSVVKLVQELTPGLATAAPRKANLLTDNRSDNDQKIVITVVVLIAVLVVVTAVALLVFLRKSSREISAKIDALHPTKGSGDLDTTINVVDDKNSIEETVSEHATKFESLVGDLSNAVKQIQSDKFDETVTMRQSLANVRADIRKFDETVLSYAELLYRMSTDELNEVAVRTNCTYLLGRLKRYFERSGLDLIIPKIGDEALEELHSIVATRPSSAEFGHMTIVDVQNIGIRRGHEVYVRAKVEVSVEDSK